MIIVDLWRSVFVVLAGEGDMTSGSSVSSFLRLTLWDASFHMSTLLNTNSEFVHLKIDIWKTQLIQSDLLIPDRWRSRITSRVWGDLTIPKSSRARKACFFLPFVEFTFYPFFKNDDQPICCFCSSTDFTIVKSITIDPTTIRCHNILSKKKGREFTPLKAPTTNPISNVNWLLISCGDSTFFFPVYII